MDSERKAIKIKRVERGWTQADLAAAAKVDVGTICRVEQGKPCTLETMARIAAAFGCSIGELLL